jgi:hypothetical protein
MTRMEQKPITNSRDREKYSQYNQDQNNYNSHQQQQQQQQTEEGNDEGDQTEKDNSTTTIFKDYEYDHTIPSFDEQLHTYLPENYIKTAYPWEWWWNKQRHEEEEQEEKQSNNNENETQYKRIGIPVEFEIRFFKVFAVDVTESTADIVAWVKLVWTYPRLKWDPSKFGNLTETNMWIEHGSGGNEASQIWTPDIYLWNQEEPMSTTLADTYAIVHYDGSVLWSRPGRIKATWNIRRNTKQEY